MIRKAIIYMTASGAEPYAEYVDALRDREGAARIKARVMRARLGNLGDHKSVGHGVIEMRVDFGPGYRVYLGLHGSDLIVLLCAGSKRGQPGDIRRALGYWADFKKVI